MGLGRSPTTLKGEAKDTLSHAKTTMTVIAITVICLSAVIAITVLSHLKIETPNESE